MLFDQEFPLPCVVFAGIRFPMTNESSNHLEKIFGKDESATRERRASPCPVVCPSSWDALLSSASQSGGAPAPASTTTWAGAGCAIGKASGAHGGLATTPNTVEERARRVHYCQNITNTILSAGDEQEETRTPLITNPCSFQRQFLGFYAGLGLS